MRYFIDENLGDIPRQLLLACDLDTTGTISNGWKGCKDPTWLPIVADQERVVITADSRISRRPSENRYFTAKGLIAVFVPNALPGETKVARMAWFLRLVATLERCSRRIEPGAKLSVRSGGMIYIHRSPNHWDKFASTRQQHDAQPP